MCSSNSRLSFVDFCRLFIAFSLISFIRLPKLTPELIDIDADWLLELSTQPNLIGRDFFFTYGPLSQFIASVGNKLASALPVIDRLTYIHYLFDLTSLVIALSIFKVIGFTSLQSLLPMTIVVFINEMLSFRSLILVLCMVILVKRFYSTYNSPNIFYDRWGIGILWFISQLCTIELLIFNILAALLFLLYSILGRQFSWKIINIFFFNLTTLIVLNLLLEVYFRISFIEYIRFDYFYYSYQFLMGYPYVMGQSWTFKATATLTLITIYLYCFIRVCYIAIHNHSTYSNLCYRSNLIVGLFIIASISLKAAIIRSDNYHILRSAAPLLICFSTVLLTDLPKGLKNNVIPLILIVFSFFTWTNYEVRTLKGLTYFIFSKETLKSVIDVPRVSDPSPVSLSLIPEGLFDSIDKNASIVSFPSANSLPIAMGLKSLAPTIQAYSAYTEPIQQFFIDKIAKFPGSLEAIWALDGIIAPQVGRVQNVSRVPIIFKYILENFEPKYEKIFLPGYLLLRRRLDPRSATLSEIETNISHNSKANHSIVELANPSECALLQLTLQISYSIFATIGRPNQLILSLFNGSQTTFTTNLVAIKKNLPFVTFVYTGASLDFVQILNSKNVRSTSPYNRIEIKPSGSDLLGIDPTVVKVLDLKCVN